jgi:hypothetical protein
MYSSASGFVISGQFLRQATSLFKRRCHKNDEKGAFPNSAGNAKTTEVLMVALSNLLRLRG